MAKNPQQIAEQLATELAGLRWLMAELEGSVSRSERDEVHQMSEVVRTLQERVGRLINDLVTR